MAFAQKTVYENGKAAQVTPKPPILVVDDDRLTVLALQKTLEREGHHVLTALSGHEALKILENQIVSVIICDLLMPEMSGTDLFIKAQTLQPDAVRIALTGHSDFDTVIPSINLGHISHFIVKPWEDISLQQTVNASVEQFKLIKENQNLNNILFTQHKALASLHDSLRRELQLGARIHETLLAGTIPSKIISLDINVMSIPAREIDGDFFEFYQPLSDIVDIAIGDVMGKGIPAALVGTAIKSQMLRFAVPFPRTHILEKNKFWEEDLLTPHEVISFMQQELIDKLIQLEYFSSLFYGRFHLTRKTFTYVDCGSPKPIHYNAQDKKITLLAGGNFPIGMVKEDKFYSTKIDYRPDDIFIFYSDGIIESATPQGELFGVDRLIKIVESNVDKNSTQIMDIIKSEVLSFSHKDFRHDDLTVVVIRVKTTSQLEKSKPINTRFSSDLSQLEALRDFVRRVCSRGAGNIDSLSSQLQLALNEIFCNIVIHGYKGKTRGPILISAEYLPEGIAFEIADQGISFDPERIQEPSFAGDKDDGFGWYIIRKINDKITYVKKVSETGWNHLRIYKRYIWGENFMQFAQTTKDNVLIITPETKSLDVKAASEFKKRVIDIISETESQNVVFDLHELQFIDSSGLGTFLSVLRVLHTQGGELKLANMNKTIRTMFELVSMHKIFEIFNSTDEAIKSFK